MTQPSFTNFFSPTLPFSFGRSSPFVCLADTLDIIIRVVFYLYWTRSFSQAVVSAREHGDHDTAPHARVDRSFLAMWLSFFLAGLPAAVKVMFITGIPGTKAMGCIYTIAFIVRAAADVVPSSNYKPRCRLPVDEFGLQSFLTRSMERRKQMMQKAEVKLLVCSWSLQLCGYLAQVAIMLWVPSTLIGPTIDRLFPHDVKPVHWHGMKHLFPFLWAVVKWLFNTAFNFIITCLVGLLAVLVVLLLFIAVGLIATVTGSEFKRYRNLDWHRIASFMFALTNLFVLLAFYWGMYSRTETSKPAWLEIWGKR